MLENIYPVPAFTDNYIWVFTDNSNSKACVVDPGDAEPVINYLTQHNLELSHILITHHHPDHTGGVATLKSRFGAFVFGPEKSPFKAIDKRLREGDTIEVYGAQFQIIDIPGHTLDHIAYYHPSSAASIQPVLFCGDTLFAAGCGRIFEGDPLMMYESLQKLAALDTRTRVYCAHEYTLANLAFAAVAEPDNRDLHNRTIAARKTREDKLPTLPSSIELELATNPFLRCGEATLKKAAEVKAGHGHKTAVEVFATVRQWKNNF